VRLIGSISESAKLRYRGFTNSGYVGKYYNFSSRAGQTLRGKCNKFELKNCWYSNRYRPLPELGQCDRKDGSDDETSQIGSISF